MIVLTDFFPLGRLLAEDIIFLTVSAVLATFDLSPFDEKHPAVFQLPTGFLRSVLNFVPCQSCTYIRLQCPSPIQV